MPLVGLADVTQCDIGNVAAPEFPSVLVEQPALPSAVEQRLHLACCWFPCGKAPVGLRDVTKTSLAGYVSPALNHAVSDSLPRVAKHRVVAIVGVEPRLEFGCGLAPFVVFEIAGMHGLLQNSDK